MDYNKCLEKNLLKKNENAKNRVNTSINTAEKFLNSARKNFEIKEFETCLIIAYNSIFHLCRALLFNKGFVERSHFCLIIALKHYYDQDEKLSNLLNSVDKVRLSRHEIQYRGEFTNKEEAQFVLNLTKNFKNHALKLLN